jgi:hypothetical protein
MRTLKIKHSIIFLMRRREHERNLKRYMRITNIIYLLKRELNKGE